jgi:hypothetical protein
VLDNDRWLHLGRLPATRTNSAGAFDTGTVREGATVSRRRGQSASRVRVRQIVTDRNTNIVLGRIIHADADPSVWARPLSAE